MALLVSFCAAPTLTAFAEEQVQDLPAVPVYGTAERPGSPNDSVSTGAKTDTPLRDLPATVSVVGAETLDEQGVTDMNRAMDNASGVQPVMGGGYGFANNYVARGMAVRFMRDGYPDGTAQNGYWRTMADVERIEVLKGPGSALYGAGQPGGTINVITKAPSKTFGLEGSAMLGSFDTYGATLDASGGLFGLATRGIVNYEKSAGFRGLSREIVEVLPSASIELSGKSRLLVDFDHRHFDIVPDNYGLIFDFNRQIVDVPVETGYFSPFNSSEQDIDRLTVAHEWQLADALEMRTALIYDQRKLDMLRNAGGNPGNAANAMTGRNARIQNDDMAFATLQNEFIWKLQTGGISHTVLAGVEGNWTRLETVRRSYNLPNIADIYDPTVPETSLESPGVTRGPAQDFDRDIDSDTYSIYLQDQLALSERWKLRAGVRADRVDFTDSGFQGVLASPPAEPNTPRFRVIEDSHTLTSGSLGAVWQPTQSLSFYTGVSSGRFINVATEAGAVSVEPESSEQAELGSRIAFLGGKANLNLAVFQTERKNYYVQLEPSPADPVPEGADRTRGVELELSAEPLPGWSLVSAFVLQDTETTADALASNAIQGVTNQSIKGSRPTAVARTGGRLWSTYELQSAALRGWGFGGGVTYKGDSYADALNLYEVPHYTVYDATVFYKAQVWEVAVNLKNLSDERYFTSPTFSGALPGEERNVMLTTRIHFN